MALLDTELGIVVAGHVKRDPEEISGESEPEVLLNADADSYSSVNRDKKAENTNRKWGWMDWNKGLLVDRPGSCIMPLVIQEGSHTKVSENRNGNSECVQEDKIHSLLQKQDGYRQFKVESTDTFKDGLNFNTTPFTQKDERINAWGEPDLKLEYSISDKKWETTDSLDEKVMKCEGYYWREQKTEVSLVSQSASKSYGSKWPFPSDQIGEANVLSVTPETRFEIQENTQTPTSQMSLQPSTSYSKKDTPRNKAIESFHGATCKHPPHLSDHEHGYDASHTKHISTFHKHKNYYCCPHCNYKTAYKVTIARHIMTVHKGPKDYGCSQCDYKAGQRGDLTKHIKVVHEGRKDHCCPHCNYRSGKKGNLTRHITTVHEGRREHYCPHCDYRFGLKGNLRMHIKIVHEGKRDYCCPHCDYRFGQKGNLTKHIKSVHEGRRDHCCPHCDYRTGQKGNLKIHIQTVHEGRKDHCCPHCDFRTRQKRTLTFHTKTVHELSSL